MNFNINFIKYDQLYVICFDIVKVVQLAIKRKERTLYKNIIDPFSAIFETSLFNSSLLTWLSLEKNRQIQKTLQNKIGLFHQKILGSVSGWHNICHNGLIDLINKEKNIIAEVKNKFNTTKGNHKINIYDDLNILLKSKYIGYTAYYVTILAKKRINKVFIPSDNRKKRKRPHNEFIREVDGKTFYNIVTGEKDAIYKIYKIIPYILSDILKNNCKKNLLDPLFEKLFMKAFNV